jgi:PAS domain S-box-containing protein/putative nucleotidyltransferase with HDIG domain
MMDETGQVESFDAEAERLFHCRAEDAVGQTVFTLLPGFPRALLKQAAGGPTSQILRLDACPKDGTRVGVELTLTKVRLGTQRFWIGALCVPSRSRPAEESLRRSEEGHRRLFEGALIGLFQMSPDGHYRRANREMARIYGYESPESLLAQPARVIREAYVVSDRRVEFGRRLEEGGRVREFESQIRRRDGSVLWIAESARAVRGPDGALLYYEGTVQDISDRKRTESDLRDSEQQLRTIFDAAAVGIARVDLSGRLTRSNPAFARMLGYAPEELAGVAFARLTHPDDAPANVQHQWDLQEGLWDGYQVEKRLGRRDGRSVWTNLAMSLVRDSEGRPQFAIAVVEDITERRMAQERVVALNERLERRMGRIAALHQIALAIMASPDMECILDLLLAQARAQLGADAAAVLLCDPHADTLAYAAGSGLRSPVTGRPPRPLAFGYAGQAARERRAVEVPDLAWMPEVFAHDPEMSAEGFTAYWAVPLIAKGEVRGVLEIFGRSPLTPDDEWRECLDVLAGQAAIAIDSATMFRDLQRSHAELMGAYEATIEGWGRALDLRDQETEGHSRRVTDLAERLARRLGMDEAQLVHVRRGALLHDIGKMGVPDRILFKTDGLTPTEWRLMRRHPQDAYDMLSPIAFLRPALDIPYGHHEKWDGTGYPQGLAGEDIPLAARLFAIVDVWDALTSDRPYRAAWSEGRTLDHLRGRAGTHFDPALVAVFLEMMTGRQEPAPAPLGTADPLLDDLTPLKDLLPLHRAA